MTGLTEVRIVGEDFSNGTIKVTFTDGKNTEIVDGKFVSSTELSCKSPDWQKYSAGEVSIACKTQMLCTNCHELRRNPLSTLV